ncbi:MAG: hypothetical protein IT377_19815 [Polyangiaceae bacterium]|nr:hypothetical protein [Polyangiaceae bacterium]
MRSGVRLAALLVLGVSVPARAQLGPVVPHPEREPRGFPRRAVELGVHGASAWVAHCDEPCQGLETWGYAAGATVLVRSAPTFAWGLVLDRASFRWQPEGREGRRAEATFVGLSARPYFTHRSRLDPWLELSVLVNTIGAGAAAGLDVFVVDHLKVGPRVHFGFAPQDRGPRSGAGIQPAPLPTPGIDAVAQIGIAVTVTVGPPSDSSQHSW